MPGKPSGMAAGVWVSIAELGRRKGIGRASAKEWVDRLEAQALIKTLRDGRNRMVELAAFDRAPDLPESGARGDDLGRTKVGQPRARPRAGLFFVATGKICRLADQRLSTDLRMRNMRS